jgi:hypothetical protein
MTIKTKADGRTKLIASRCIGGTAQLLGLFAVVLARVAKTPMPLLGFVLMLAPLLSVAPASAWEH